MSEITYDPAEKASYKERFDNWKTAIGLQAVDNLTPSVYLTQLAQEHIEGKLTISDVERLIEGYYESSENRIAAESTRQNEADLISARIAKLLETKTFALTENSLKTIHRKLFSGFTDYSPGKYRKYDIVKSEWVLDGDTVQYAHWDLLENEVALLVHNEQAFYYSELSTEEKVNHIIDFTSKLWVLHAFLEGNTRAIAILIIKHLRSLGFNTENEPFDKNSWYFRNALARANYRNSAIGIAADNTYLRYFFGNLLLQETNELSNRMLHIHWGTRSIVQQNDPVNGPLNPVIVAVLNQIIANPKSTYDDIAAAIGKSRTTVRRAIRTLKETGRITRTGSDKTGYWSLSG